MALFSNDLNYKEKLIKNFYLSEEELDEWLHTSHAKKHHFIFDVYDDYEDLGYTVINEQHNISDLYDYIDFKKYGKDLIDRSPYYYILKSGRIVEFEEV